MPRPNRALCGIVLGLAVIVGCAKKSKTDSVSTGSGDPAPVPPQSSKNGPPGGPVKVQPTGGTVPVESQPPPKETVAAITSVELVQGQFDKVEAALTAAKGKVVLVDCWAVWCPPCVATFPKLVEKNEKYKDKGLVCLSVSLDAGRNSPDKVLAFLKQRNAMFQNFYMTNPSDPKLDARFGKIEFIPYAVLFNKQGEKIWQGNPGPNESKVTAMIEAELVK